MSEAKIIPCKAFAHVKVNSDGSEEMEVRTISDTATAARVNALVTCFYKPVYNDETRARIKSRYDSLCDAQGGYLVEVQATMVGKVTECQD